MASVFLLASLAFGQAATRIPEVTTDSLSGQKIQLPENFVQPATILILGFSQKASTQAERWGREVNLMKACDGGPHIQWYELPFMGDVPRLMRPVVVGAIRYELTPELRQHFAPVYTDLASWKSKVNFSEPDDAYVLVVKKDGTIGLTVHGSFDEAKRASVTNQVRQACLGR